MELKEYQKKTLKQVKLYLDSLAEQKEKSNKAREIDTDMAFDFAQKAWEKTFGGAYFPAKNGLGEYLPNFYIKNPTGGGKTLLACHTIDLANRSYLKKQTGIVLWIVPTTQIYRQTFQHLKNRDHPYRQVLDIASGGRALILEKTDRFTPQDIRDNLVVMMLMLPAANRQNKETLKVFRDSGGFAEFFPGEDNIEANKKLLNQFPNLDYFGDHMSFYGKIVKTSLGNTLRIHRPFIIIDEGHKAYSETARDTIHNFNPSMMVELSATPPKNCNTLANITGAELNREEMIKLDMHITTKISPEWQDTIRAAMKKRDELGRKAREYESNTGEYIRPICLIQVERTGKEQRGSRFIHSEDVKEWLIKQAGISEEKIAIKSSEKDDIEGIDLFGRDCKVKYIITKHALQEGWDCSFAYVLAILTNPSSQLSITQLVGRILRQPFARKTKIKELDESYIFCFQQKAKNLLDNVRKGLEEEGLGDLAGRITIDSGEPDAVEATQERVIKYRDKFKVFEGKIYLPKFIMQEKDGWRDLSYEMDILSRIDWATVNINDFRDITLSNINVNEQELVVNIDGRNGHLVEEARQVYSGGGFDVNNVFITRQIIDIVPNPWQAYEIGAKAFKMMMGKYANDKISANLVFILEELRKLLERKRDRMAEQIFRELIVSQKLCFFLLADRGGYRLPAKMEVKNNTKKLVRHDNSDIMRSLFEIVPEDELNTMEQSIAIYLDEQEKLLWWYRNLSRQDYYIQGWKKNRIYPDFIFAKDEKKKQTDYSKVFVLETKGTHLRNDDTDYKNNIFKICNEMGEKLNWGELGLEFSNKKVAFQVIYGNEWQEKINQMFEI